MQNLGVNEIRQMFLHFFEQKSHLMIKSFSLVPQNDNSLLLINSGMAPMKPYFTGQQIPPNKRVTTCQKCIRTGDIENVGKTARHGTFFEMLGNFSFGNYFKEEAIPWAWEFFTQVLKLPEDKLYASVYKDDDEAFDIWKDKVRIPTDHIIRLGADNFWEHGTGPCGPCSEIYFDKGAKYGCDDPNCSVGCDCDRYMEIWNLVFTQYNKEDDGSYSPLKETNIDTGMGLERIATVMQGVDSIFDIDTLKSLRDKVSSICGKNYGDSTNSDISLRVITDHIRAITFMTADGVLPSNEGRGYVLRRLLRRAVRHGKLLGINNLFLSDLSKIVIECSKDAYPELIEKKEHIYKILTVEEERFHSTIDNGMELLNKKINELNANKLTQLDGKEAFKLYDTYGFPLDLMKEILDEKNMTVDEHSFEQEMQSQKNKARSAREESSYLGTKETAFHKLDPSISSEFVGYIDTELKSSVLAIICDENIVTSAQKGDKVAIIVDKTPFYPEKGGQMGDKGTISSDNLIINVYDCTNFGDNKIIHHGNIEMGEINVSDTINLSVSISNRLDITRNHTATHLLHKALKEILGEHVEQAGSMVSKDRLRFDFTHFEPPTKDQLALIENTINTNILKGLDVNIKEMDIASAKKAGAVALFGEKYGNIVRVINIGGYSVELCGGTHVKNTSLIGSFKLVSEGGISAGVRRIEAVTGFGALTFYNEREQILSTLCTTLKTTTKNITTKLSTTLDENKHLSKQIDILKNKLSSGLLDDILKESQLINNMNVLITKVTNIDTDTLRNMGDNLKNKLDNAIILLANESENKVTFIAMCSDYAINSGIKAGDIVKIASAICGGGGGGRPNMAQAGGKDISKIDDALKKVLNHIMDKS